MGPGNAALREAVLGEVLDLDDLIVSLWGTHLDGDTRGAGLLSKLMDCHALLYRPVTGADPYNGPRWS